MAEIEQATREIEQAAQVIKDLESKLEPAFQKSKEVTEALAEAERLFNKVFAGKGTQEEIARSVQIQRDYRAAMTAWEVLQPVLKTKSNGRNKT